MNRPGVGGSPIHASVRESVVAIIAEANELRPGLKIGLRLAGGDPHVHDIESCSASSLALPVADVDPAQWLGALDAVEPQGLRPLIGSVLAALDDLDPGSKNRRVVVVTSGDDQCGNGPQQVGAALTGEDRPPDLRMVGLGLDQTVLDRFGAVPTRNATTAVELLAALRWAVLDIEDGPRPSGNLLLQLTSGAVEPVVARVDLTEMATGNTHTDTITGSARFELPAGRYRLTVEPETGDRNEFRDLLMIAGTDIKLDLELRPWQLIAIDIGTDPAIAGAQTWFDLGASAPNLARLLFVDGNALAVSQLTDPTIDDGWAASPTFVGPLELLLVEGFSNGVRRVLARRPVTVVSRGPELTAPDDLSVGEDFVVGWSGPRGSGDFVGLVPREGGPTEVVSCATVGASSEARLAAPLAEAELDLIYVVGATMSVAARHPLQVTAPKASVSAPDRVAAGDEIEVTWIGPEGDEDFLSLALAESPDNDYVKWARVEDGNPTVFSAPNTPGDFEVRYVDGMSGEVRARISIVVETIPIELRAPATVTAGMRIEVQWTGPASPGDFLAISRIGAASDRYLDWASTTIGSPITLAAPSRPNTYEIRYLAQSGREVLARITIEVQP